MPTKNQILLKFQKDLQDLNARFQTQIDTIEQARLDKFRSMKVAQPLVDDAEAKGSQALEARTSDRAHAAAGRDAAIAATTSKRRAAFTVAERAWHAAEDEAVRLRDDNRLKENRTHADKLAEIEKARLSEQSALREAEDARHETAVARIEEDFNIAWERAREDYQRANGAALDDELRDTEAANEAAQAGLDAADAEYAQTLDNVAAQLHDGLLRWPETRSLEEGFQQQIRDVRQRWEADKETLRAQFKKDYEGAPSA